MSGKGVRIPFLPLTYNREYMGEPGELMIDLENERLYIKSKDKVENINIVHRDNIIPEVELAKDLLLGDVTGNEDTLSKLRDLLQPILDWRESITTSDTNIVDTIDRIFNSFNGINHSDVSLLEMISEKVDAVSDGRGYSDNNFTDTLKLKLDNIEYMANNYEHPEKKVCNYQPEVISVNGKYNDIVLSKLDIEGLETVHPDANYYVHPIEQQCSFTFPIKTVNGMVGNVVITKDDVNLDLVENLKLAKIDDIINLDPDAEQKYLTPKTLYDTIKYKLFGEATPNDGRVAVKVNLIPDFAEVIFRLRPKPKAQTMSILNDWDFINWTYGLLYRLEPGEYEYEVSETKEWAHAKGTFTVYEDKPFTLDVLLDDLAPFYTSIINVKGPGIERAYIDDEPYVQPRLMTTENGKAISKCIPGNKYKYVLSFGSGFPDAHGEFTMPGEDNLIIHVGGGTPNDEGMADKDDYDSLLKPPATKGKITVTTDPQDAKFTLMWKNYKEEGKKFEIDFMETYKYICTMDGYESVEGEIKLQPWEESENIVIKLSKYAGFTVKVYPSTIDDMSVEINVNDAWHDLTRGKVFHNYTHYYYQDTHDGDIMDEYVSYTVDGIPEGQYKYRVRTGNIPIFEDNVDIKTNKSVTKEVKIKNSLSERYYDIYPDVTPDDEHTLYISVNGYESIYEGGGYKIYGDETPTILITAFKYNTGEQFTFNIYFKEPASTHGGIVQLPLNIKSEEVDESDTPGEDAEDSVDDTESKPTEKDPNLQYGDLYVHIIPEDATLKVDGGIGRDGVKDDKPCKVFTLVYDHEYDYELSKEGYQTDKGIVIKDRDSFGIDYSLEIFKKGECVFLINPITVDNVKVQISTSNGWIEAKLDGEKIKDREYKIYDDGQTSTTSEYSIFKANDIPHGSHNYRVTIGGVEIKTGVVEHDGDEGSTTIVNIGTYSKRYYDISFEVSSEEITLPDAQVEVMSDSNWVKVNKSFKLEGEKNRIQYRVRYIGFETFTEIKSFKDYAIKGGGKVVIPIRLKEKDPDATPEDGAGDSSMLPDNQRYIWINVEPFDDVQISISGYAHKYQRNLGTSSSPYWRSYSDSYTSTSTLNEVVELDGERCYQNIFYIVEKGKGGYFDTSLDSHHESEWYTVTVSKEGYETKNIKMSWRDVEDRKVHLYVILKPLVPVEFKVNPITLDNVSIVLSGNDSNENAFSRTLVRDSEIDLGPGDGVYTSSLKDNQFATYRKTGSYNDTFYKELIPEGAYEYEVKVSSQSIIKKDILITDSHRGDVIRIGSHSDRYYYVDFSIVSNTGVEMTKALLYIFNKETQRWVSQSTRRYYKFSGLQKTLIYAVVLEGFVTVVNTVNLHGNAIHAGCRFKETIRLSPGNSRPPEVPEVDEYEPTDEDELSINDILLKIKVNASVSGLSEEEILDKLSMSGARTNRIVFIPGVGKVREFLFTRGRGSTITLNLHPDYENIRKSINVDSPLEYELLKKLPHSKYNDIYTLSPLELVVYRVKLHPLTIDNVTVRMYARSSDNKEAITPKRAIVLKRGKEVTSIFNSDMSVQRREYVYYESEPLPRGYYDTEFQVSGFTIFGSIDDSQSNMRYRFQPRFTEMDVDLGSHLNRYYEFRIIVKSGNTYLNANVQAWDRTGTPRWVNMYSRKYESGVSYRYYRVTGNNNQLEVKVTLKGYRDITQTIRIPNGKDAIHGGIVITKTIFMSAFDNTNKFRQGLVPYTNEDITYRFSNRWDDKITTIKLSNNKRFYLEDNISINSVFIDGDTTHRFNFGKYVLFAVEGISESLRPKQMFDIYNEGSYAMNIIYLVYGDRRDVHVRFHHKHNILIDEGANVNTDIRYVQVYVPAPAGTQQYIRATSFNQNSSYQEHYRLRMQKMTMPVNNFPEL